MLSITEPKCSENDPRQAGKLASSKVLFGEASRYAVFAVHTRFDAVEWFVTDAETVDEVTDGPAVVRQADRFEDAVGGMVPCDAEPLCEFKGCETCDDAGVFDCRGHASIVGPIGSTNYCDGTCRAR